MLSCRDLTVARGSAVILRRVSLDVPSGALTVLAGPSGSGKTTLLRAIVGLEPLQEGRVVLDGRDVSRVPTHRRRISVVFPEPRLLGHLSVVENVAFGLRAAGVRRGARLARAEALLAEVGLSAVGPRRIQGLSTGEQQRVAVARALCTDPDLLLLDEPLAAVDPNRREGLRRLIARIQRERRLTTVLVTHDRAEAAELGDTIALLLEGRIIQHDAPQVLFEQPASAAVARFFGATNLLRGEVVDGRLQVGAGSIPCSGPDGYAVVAIRPEHVQVADDAQVFARLVEATYLGTHVRLTLAGDEFQLEAHVRSGAVPAVGAMVGIELPAAHLWRLDDDATASPRADAAATV